MQAVKRPEEEPSNQTSEATMQAVKRPEERPSNQRW
jgi:hypothetical protein